MKNTLPNHLPKRGPTPKGLNPSFLLPKRGPTPLGLNPSSFLLPKRGPTPLGLNPSFLKTIIISFLFIFLPTPALAIDSIPLTVSPVRQQMEMQPGETSTGILKLINISETPISGTLKAVDFIVEDDQGTPVFLDNQNFSSKYSAASWVTLPYNRLSIPANDKIEIQFKIKADQNALPGGHYTGIIFEAVSGSQIDTNSSGASISPRIASLIYITIPGDYQEQALVTKFSIPKFSQNGPLPVSTTILNQSPAHIRPTGVITITNMFGDILTNLPLDEQNIFPETERVYSNTIPTKWLIGRYQADLQATYGTQGKTLQATIFFTVIPVMLIIYILILIIAVIYIVRHFAKKNKKHEQELEVEIEKLKKELHQS